VFTYQSAQEQALAVTEACAGLTGEVSFLRHDLLGDDPQDLVTSAVERLGGLDSVVLNAGWWRGGTVSTLDPETWWRVVETNLRSTHGIARASLPHLEDSPAGSLLLVSSAVAVVGFAGDTAYGSAKAALVGFARSLAKEVGRTGVRVNVLAPGFVSTDMTAEIPDTSRDKILQRTVLRRFATADEMAASVVFLSEDATFATGAVLSCDGGWTL